MGLRLQTGQRKTYALVVHGTPRATGDLDIWIRTDPGNVELVGRALRRFGAPVDAPGISREDLETPGNMVQMGLPSRRIDLLTELSGVTFEEAWRSRVVHEIETLQVPFLGKEMLIRNKRRRDTPDVDVLPGGGEGSDFYSGFGPGSCVI